jgi:N-dimethylarginine dimethylaminohydrolase
MSYPGTGFRPPGTSTASSNDAQRAFQQWLTLCDQISRAGGRILVLDPSSDISLAGANRWTDPVFAAQIGAPFLAPATGQGPLFLRARGSEDNPSLDQDPISTALRHAGLQVQLAQHRWQGQAEIIALPRNRFLLTYGSSTDSSSCDEIKRLLPLGAQALSIEVGLPTGLSCIAHFLSKGGDSLLLVQRSALRSHTPEDIGKFVAGGVTELHILGAEDIAAHAAESLCVRGTVHMPPGVSTQLRGHLARRGFQIVAVDVSAIFGQDGGGPRALCSEWPGFVLSDDSPSYLTRRDELFARLETYGSPSSPM